jgi:EAL domain-containing protein (putative c-di-GMP-specific phosphodiesterase class I)
VYLSGRSDTSHDDEFDALVGGRQLSAVFQPVVVIDTGQIVGYEALIRGPASSMFEFPDALFEHAYRVGRVAELDWVCRVAAFRGAAVAGLPGGTVLLINVEPVSLRIPCPPDLQSDFDAGLERFTVVGELTERALTDDPAAVLEAVRFARDGPFGIAVDDVGAQPASLAMMPLLNPDIVKLDLSLVQGQTGPVQAQIINAVLAESERTGATILAEGIETVEHAEVARTMGAELGQGWLYGVPSAHPPMPALPEYTVRRLPIDSAPHETPYQVVTKLRPSRPTTKRLLVPLSRWIESKAADASEPAVLLASFQQARNFDERTRKRYAYLARRASLVVALGAGMGPEPVPGVRGTSVRSDDPLAREWAVIVIGPHFAAALVAVERPPRSSGPGEDPERRLDYAITHNRELVIAAARPILYRLEPRRV